LPAEDAARLLAVEPSWLLRQAREGRIGHVRIGKYIRFDPQDIVGRCTRQAVTRGSAILR
jgi:excisionase family DNA binding protein